MQLGALIEKFAADITDQQEHQSVNITKVKSRKCSWHPQKSTGKLSKSRGLQEVPL